MPSVEIMAVGTELLLGQLVDTNTPYVAQELAGIGLDVFAAHTVGDNRERIAAAIRSAFERADGVISTGGLGPTIDDLTKEAVCDVLGCDVELHEPSVKMMEKVFSRAGRAMRENNRKQAMIPRGAIVLGNKRGTAPGFIAIAESGKFVACMPGVPREMKPMLAESLIPWLREHFNLRDAVRTRILHTIDIAESEIDHRIADLFGSLENPKIAVLAHEYQCDVKIMAKATSEEDAISLTVPVEHELVKRLDGHIYGVDDQTLPGSIHVLLQQTRRTIAVAESCTGGSISARLTSAPGASKSFLGGIVAYDNAVKVNFVGVNAHTIAAHGAVSEETCVEMARGIREKLHASIGLAITGIAGPDGGTAEKPIGLIWIAAADGEGARTLKLNLPGDRAAIQTRATVAALGFLWKMLAAAEPISV
ncbi:MAG TPA: competence/damage-inducible protein A [Candidatus Rubrimentiphilum sp.]|nr:competence/damage-inducible protein A [Candidatus Rubrimentiphilum sp.]